MSLYFWGLALSKCLIHSCEMNELAEVKPHQLGEQKQHTRFMEAARLTMMWQHGGLAGKPQWQPDQCGQLQSENEMVLLQQICSHK